MPRENPPPFHECTSVMSPISSFHIYSQAMRVATEEYPWLPIWVATLYFRAALASSRASQIVAVSGF